MRRGGGGEGAGGGHKRGTYSGVRGNFRLKFLKRGSDFIQRQGIVFIDIALFENLAALDTVRCRFLFPVELVEGPGVYLHFFQIFLSEGVRFLDLSTHVGPFVVVPTPNHHVS